MPWVDGSTETRLTTDVFYEDTKTLMPDVQDQLTFWDDPLGIGYACVAPVGITPTTPAVGNANTAIFGRLISGGLVNKIQYTVSVAAGNIMFGIFDTAIYATGGYKVPGHCLWQSGSFAAVAGDQQVSVPSIVCKARKHWFSFWTDSATLSMYYTGNAIQNISAFADWQCAAQITSGCFPSLITNQISKTTENIPGAVHRFPTMRGLP